MNSPFDPAPATDSTTPAHDDPALDFLSRRRQFTPEALRHLLEVKSQLMFGQALALADWRERGDRTAAMFAEIKRLELKVLELSDAIEILQRRLEFIPAAQRIRFRPEGRFDVVVHARTFGLSRADAARRFLVDEITIGRWQQAAQTTKDAGTIGSTLKATPPVRAVADVVRETVAQLDRMKVGGSRRIAEFLARSGVRIGRETVRRIRKNSPPLGGAGDPDGGGFGAMGIGADASCPTKTIAALGSPILRAKAPNHVWLSDITTITTFFGLWTLKVVAVLDVFSRFPLAFRVFWKEPTAAEVRDVVGGAIERFGVPKHFVTDQGSQFIAGAFEGLLDEPESGRKTLSLTGPERTTTCVGYRKPPLPPRGNAKPSPNAL